MIHGTSIPPPQTGKQIVYTVRFSGVCGVIASGFDPDAGILLDQDFLPLVGRLVDRIQDFGRQESLLAGYG